MSQSFNPQVLIEVFCVNIMQESLPCDKVLSQDSLERNWIGAVSYGRLRPWRLRSIAQETHHTVDRPIERIFVFERHFLASLEIMDRQLASIQTPIFTISLTSAITEISKFEIIAAVCPIYIAQI